MGREREGEVKRVDLAERVSVCVRGGEERAPDFPNWENIRYASSFLFLAILRRHTSRAGALSRWLEEREAGGALVVRLTCVVMTTTL